jgi:hypothetical protein
MAEPKRIAFDAADFLARAGLGRRIVQLKPKEAFFSQGHPADYIFYLQKGRAKLTVVSTGKRPPSRFSLTAISWEKNPSPPWAGGVWPQPLPLPHARR